MPLGEMLKQVGLKKRRTNRSKMIDQWRNTNSVSMTTHQATESKMLSPKSSKKLKKMPSKSRRHMLSNESFLVSSQNIPLDSINDLI